MSEPKCYSCIHRRDVSGDRHSQCRHPATDELHQQPVAQLLALLGSRAGATTNLKTEPAKQLGIVGHWHGIAQGWFIWPFNFDPIWLRNCVNVAEALLAAIEKRERPR